MTTSLLASASTNVIKVWDLVSNFGKKTGATASQQSPEQLFGVEHASFSLLDSTAVNCVRWSHDHQLLAVAGNEGTLALHNEKGALVESIPLNVEEEYPKINSIRFANQSQHLLFGGSDKVVHVWNCKESKLIDTLKGNRSSITCIDVNMDETLVACSDSTGNITIHNRQQSSSNNLVVLSNKPINMLEYSYYKPGLLAAGSEDGTLRLWDTCASTTALQTFENVHFEPIKGIAFSPHNSSLMCSSGLDKRIVLYDVCKKATLKTLHANWPLTTLAFKSDGCTLAAGTLQGKIIIYDLRSMSKPMCTLLGHEPHPIQSLHFQGKEKLVERRTGSRAKTHTRSLSKGKIVPKSGSPIPQITNNNKQKDYMDMFSPVKDDKVSEPGENLRAGSQPDSSVALKSRDKTPQGTMNEPIQPPHFQEKEKPVERRIDSNRLLKLKDGKVGEPSESLKAGGQLDSSVAPKLKNEIPQGIMNDPPHFQEKEKPVERRIDSNRLLKLKDEKVGEPSENLKAGGQSDSSIVPKLKDETPQGIVSEPTQPPHFQEKEKEEPAERRVDSSTFQYQILENIVDECLQEFRISLRNDIQNMHLELLRQFHIQKTEMEKMFLKYCRDTMSLQEEVERLREENQRLKMKY